MCLFCSQERLVEACKCVVLAYADREEHAMGLELSLPGQDHSALIEEVKETTALVMLALRSMMHISEEQASGGVLFIFVAAFPRRLYSARCFSACVSRFALHSTGSALFIARLAHIIVYCRCWLVSCLNQ